MEASVSALVCHNIMRGNLPCPLYKKKFQGLCFYIAIYWPDIHYSKKLKEHVDIMIFIERYPLKRCQGCVKLIASKVNCFLNINDLIEVQLCMSSNSWTWECPHTKDGADHVPLIFLSSVYMPDIHMPLQIMWYSESQSKILFKVHNWRMKFQDFLFKISINKHKQLFIHTIKVLEIGCPNLLEISKQGVQTVHLQYVYMEYNRYNRLSKIETGVSKRHLDTPLAKH